jgi:hypothetical protein
LGTNFQGARPPGLGFRSASVTVAAVYEDSHEPRLKVKDENIGTNSTDSYFMSAGSQSRSQSGGQSPL